MGLNQDQLRRHIIRPTLDALGLGGLAAENLMLGTALIESRLEYVAQIEGPAVSLWQIEPFTYADLLARLRAYRKPFFYQKTLELLNMAQLPTNANYLMGNMVAACIFARLKYYFIPEELPANNPTELASYYKRYYNTPPGKADVVEAAKVFRSVIVGYVYYK